MASDYDSSSIEVLTGLEPVRKRPGMYTTTERPNHLIQEVVDNSVDEAIAGHCKKIEVTLFKDGSVEVVDDGRGMPTDLHPEEKIPGVEVIMTKLHAGGKFSNKNYEFSGGLHGVGISVVNALSKNLEVWVKRGGIEYNMAFADGSKVSDLEEVGTVGVRNTGTRIRFWPDPSFFDSATVHVGRLTRLLRAKAVLCPGLTIVFEDEAKPQNNQTWFYEDGLKAYLMGALGDNERLPVEGFQGQEKTKLEQAEWIVAWSASVSELITESYVNLIPTIQGGTHVNGLRIGLTEAIREFCDFRNLLPKGLKLSPDDVWANCQYVLSVRMQDPQFSGQTKERLSSREISLFVSTKVKDAFALWLNQNVAEGEQIAALAIDNAQSRLKSAKKVTRKKITSGPALPGKLADCSSEDLDVTELFLVEGDSAGGSAKQARDRKTQAIMPLRGKILNTWEVESAQVLASQEVHDISVALGVDPGSNDLEGLRYGKICILADADSDGLHIATLLCALFVRHFRPVVEAGHLYVAMPPLYRIDQAKQVFYALDDVEHDQIIAQIKAEKANAKINVQRFKGLGEMNPSQLRETTMQEGHRRLVQMHIGPGDDTNKIMNMLLAKKEVPARKKWLTEKGDQAEVQRQLHSARIQAVSNKSLKAGLYQHYKGPLYRVIGVSTHSETQESLVLYQTLYGNRSLWCRPFDMFVETVESADGGRVSRFAYAPDQTLVLEVAHLTVKTGRRQAFLDAFEQARTIIERQSGFIYCELKPSAERDHEFLLQVGWQNIDDHKKGFRESSDYQQWSRLLHQFYEPFPTVDYYQIADPITESQ